MQVNVRQKNVLVRKSIAWHFSFYLQLQDDRGGKKNNGKTVNQQIARIFILPGRDVCIPRPERAHPENCDA